MKVILCEKNSAARNFAKALGGMAGCFDGENYQIVAARGHLYEFVSPEEQVPISMKNIYNSWDLNNLPWDEKIFSWKRVKKKDTSAVIRNIVTACKNADEVIVATDNDPTGEGQLIAFEIILENNIKVPKYSRMWFDDESVKSIQKSFKNRTVIPNLSQDFDYIKAQYRAQWDFLSMQFTRIATKLGDGRSLLRQGRLKSAMVLLVGNQLKAFNDYKQIPFYTNKFKDENGNIFTSPDELSYKTEDEVPSIYMASKIVIDSKTVKNSAPSKLIDLAGLSALLSAKGIKAKDVLKTYQNMYEVSIVSYPRTEDKYITIEQFNDLLPKIDKIAKVVGVDPSILTHRIPRNTHVKKGMAHGANRPGSVVPNDINDLAKFGPGAIDIYKIVAKSYLAMLAEDYEYEHQKGHVKDYPKFVGSVNVPISQGWHQVSYDLDEDGDISNVGLGEIAKPFVYRGFPPKPQWPTMKWLMKQLEKYDVGTGATRTSIYADVTNERTKYPLLKEKRGKIDMVELGQMSYLLLPDTHIGDLTITESLMNEMKLISQGKMNPADGLAKIKQLVKDDIMTMTKNGQTMRKELGKTMIERKEKYNGVWLGNPVSFNRVWGGHYFTDEECKALCNDETISIFGLKNKKGEEYGVEGKLADQTYEGKSYIGFKRLGFANKPGVPYKWCGHVFTDEEKKALEDGQSVYIEGALSQKGNVFDCHVIYGKNDHGQMKIIPQFNK